MSLLRLGVATAVFNEQKEILLSKRGDFDVWNLPTGRLDKGEFIGDGAKREVREETGVECDIERAVGLYYQAGRQRLNVLFEGRVVGGEVLQSTDETKANQFFDRLHLPANIFGDFMVRDAFTTGTHLFTLESPKEVLRRIQRQLAIRWIKNLLAGKPEPRWARFEVQASLAVMDAGTHATLSVPHTDGARVLPGLVVNGDSPIWEQVKHYVRNTYELYELREAELRWIGLFHNKSQNRLEFVFATDITPHSALRSYGVDWTTADSERWWHGYKPFIQHIALRRTDVKLVYQE